MKARIANILCAFAVATIIMAALKLLSMAYVGGYSPAGGMAAVGHGLSMDMSVAAYLCALPALALAASALMPSARALRVTALCIKTYMAVAATAISLGFCSNAALYPYWGFPLDTTPLFYFATSPSAAMASLPWWQWVVAALAIAALAWAIYKALSWAALSSRLKVLIPARRWRSAAAALAVALLLFVPMRGGFTVATMNVGRAYFSHDMKLNHAAVNPLFSLLYSATHIDRLDRNLRLIDPAEAAAVMQQLDGASDSVPHLPFKPDVQLIVLESFSAEVMPSLGGEPIAMRLDSIAQSGWLFSNLYASSFRTDRALAALLCGYPAVPTTSVMRYPSKLQSLPSIARSLADAGYTSRYYYGGDTNFTNMQALLLAAGFDQVVSDKDFAVSQKLSKWGAHDDVLFARALSDAKIEADAPRFTVIQTSSSHDPFEVPGPRRMASKEANSIAFADSCLGDYIDSLRMLPSWPRTLIAITADHYGTYPVVLSDHQRRHHVPLVLTGGAIESIEPDSALLSRIASQTDIAATLLALAGADHSEFGYSHNLLDPARKPYAYFSEPDWIAMLTPDGFASISVADEKPLTQAPDSLYTMLKAYILTLYDDMARR